MARNLIIIHMDDEYDHMLSIYPLTFSGLVCTHWIENEGQEDAYCMAEEASAFSGDTNVKLYEFDCPVNSGAKYRYLFCGGTKLPNEAVSYLDGCDKLFIVDILRQSSSGRGSEVVAQQIINSLQKHNGAVVENIVLFTAIQGPEAEKIVSDNPGIELISKLDVDRLEERLRLVFEASLGDV